MRFKTTYTLSRNFTGGHTITMVTPITIGSNDIATTTTKVNELGLKTYEEDAEGLITETIYDFAGNPANIIRKKANSSSGQLETNYVYDTKYNKPISTVDPNGNFSKFDYNAQGDLTKITLPTNDTITMSYGSNGDLLSSTDERGLITRFENFDQFGNPQTIRRETERNKEVVTNHTFDARSRLKTSSSTLGPSVTNTYDALDRVKSAEANDPSSIRDSSTTTYTYLPAGQVASVSVSGGVQNYQATNSYDTLERLKVVTETGNSINGSLTRTFTYDRNSNVETETDRRGVTTTYSYNELNFPIEMKMTGAHSAAAESNVISITPDKVGNPKNRTDIYGNTITYGYDVFHRLTSRAYPGNLVEILKLDANGNLLEFRDRNGRLTKMTYDLLNRPSLVTDALSRKISYTYDDAAGKVTRSYQPQGLTVETTTDALNRPLSEKVMFGSTEYVTNYNYNGRNVQITDPRGTVATKNLSAMGDVGDSSLTLENGTVLKNEMRYAALGGVRLHKDANNRTTTFVVDALGRTVSASYPTTPQLSESFQYDGEGLLTSHTDRRGIVSTMTYDNMRRELETNMGGIRISKHDYNNAARTETKTDANNHSTVCVYDGLMRLVSLTNADGKLKTYEYDGENLIKESDFKGRKSEYKSEYKYDAINRLIELKDRTTAQITTISHTDAGGHRTDTSDRRGNHRIEVYDALSRLTSLTEGGQLFASYEYDGNNNRTASIDGRNNRTVYMYDRANRVKSIIHADNLQTETFEYDGVGNTVSHNDGFGPSVTMTYDGLNHPLTQTDGAGNVTNYKYDGEGLLLEQVEPKGATGSGFKTLYQYNALRSLRELRDAKGGVWSYGYDNAQNMTSMVDALSRLTSYEYDSLNRLTKVTQPDNLITQYEYDANNNRTAVIDAKGQRTTVAYDELDRAQQVEYLASGGGLASQGPRRHQFGYDPEGNLTSVEETNALNGIASTRQYSRTYDARDRLVTATDANGKVVQYGYDATNNVTSITDAASKQTSYTYDALNRLSTVQMSGSRAATYRWKADGLLENIQYPSGMQRSYSYDNADRLTKVTNALGGGASEEFIYTYDANSNRQTETRKRDETPHRTLSYQYDELNRLTKVGYSTRNGLIGEYFNNRDFTSPALIRNDATVDFTWAGTQTPAPEVQDNTYSVRWSGKVEAQHSEVYTFYAESDEAVKVWVNDQLVIDDANDHGLHEANGSITLQANQKYNLKIEYSENTGDAAMKLSWSSTSQPKQVIPQNRLFTHDSINYTYDAVGNRQSESGMDFNGALVNRSYSHDALNRLQQVSGDALGNITFQYDNNGNLTSQTQGLQTTRYEYDTRDQLRKVLIGSTGSTEVASFDYDYTRRRLSKTVASTTTSYVYDGTKIINEFGADNRLVNRYDYGTDLLRGELDGEGERFYFSDALGSTTSLSAINGGNAIVASRFEYDSWGVVTAASSVSANQIGYTGQRLDSETGLMALGNGERYYSPALGQFIQQDSFPGMVTVPQSLNRQSYAHNNPVLHTDPSGHIILPVIVAGAIVILAVHAFEKKTEHDLDRAKGYEPENGGNTWALGVSDAFGMTQLYRGASGAYHLGNRRGINPIWDERALGNEVFI
jgi:RHS repeat-associated protein